MSANDKRRQKKLERRHAKRKQRHREITKQRNLGLSERLKAATAYPILDSLVSHTLMEEGICNAILSRQLPTGEVAHAVFLVDRYCLGVKNAFGGVVTRAEYQRMVEKADRDLGMKRIDPADLRYLVEQAVEFARGLGLEPHPAYSRVSSIFGDIDTEDASLQVEFGSDGKPLFISDSDDEPYKRELIIETLRQSCGDDGFHYLLHVSMDNQASRFLESSSVLPSTDSADSAEESED